MKHPAIIALTILAVSLTPVFAQTAARPEGSNTGMQPPMAGPANLALIDVNKASKYDLDGLPGIEPALVEAIIKGRPYVNKDDLVRKNIIPQTVYDGIKNRIIAAQ